MTKITKRPVSLFMLLFATLSFTAAAQSSSTPHQMGIKIIPLSQDVEKVSLSQTSKIETKIQRLVSNYGLSAIEHIQNLVIYFKYEIYEENTIKTIPKYVYTVKAQLNLRILETKSQIEFGNYSQTLKGEGYTIDAAIDKSIARFQTRNSSLTETMSKNT